MYTATAEYAPTNQENIKKVMADLQAMARPDISYTACLQSDGKTFIHTAFFKNEDAEKELFALPSFQSFQQQLKASGPEVPPKTELLTLVGWSNNIFNV
jgi:hypothetical protein